MAGGSFCPALSLFKYLFLVKQLNEHLTINSKFEWACAKDAESGPFSVEAEAQKSTASA